MFEQYSYSFVDIEELLRHLYIISGIDYPHFILDTTLSIKDKESLSSLRDAYFSEVYHV